MTWKLYLDIGNTNIHWAAHANGEWKAEGRLPTALLGTDALHAHLNRPLEEIGLPFSEVSRVVAVTSSPEDVAVLDQCVRAASGHNLLLVGRDLHPTIEVDYYEPSRIGVDRVLNAFTARELCGAPCIVLDFGTCLSCEAISSDGRLVGGAIAAGLPVILSGLSEEVSRLRRPFEKAIREPPAEGPGRDPEENLRLGCVGGLAAVADWLVDSARNWVGAEAQAIATGGDAQLIAPICRNELKLRPMLALEGIRLLEAQSSAE